MDTKALRQKILDLAIRGKLVPQDPKDEPAAVLLERIRAEKMQMVKDGKLKPKDIKNDTIIYKGDDNLHYEKFSDGTVKCIEDEIPFEVPEGWEWTRIQNIAQFQGGFAYKSSKYVEKSNNIIIRIGNVKNNELNPQIATKYISNEYALETSSYKIRSNDILFTMTGTRGKRDYFYSCLVSLKELKDMRLYLNQRVGCLRIFNIDYIFPKFFLIALQSRFVLDEIFKTETGNVSQGNIGSTATLNLLVPILPVNEQKRVIGKINLLFALVKNIEKNKLSLIDDVSSVKSKILDLAIRGKLVPQDTNDEPASMLLERIRSEKEELIKQGKIKRDKKESVIFKGDDNSYYEKYGEKLPSGWVVTNFETLLLYEQPTNYIVKNTNYKTEYKTPVLTAGKSFILGYTNEKENIFSELPVIIFDDFTTESKFVDFQFKVKSSAMKILHINTNLVLPKFAFYLMQATQIDHDNHQRYWISTYSQELLGLPPINEQKRILSALEFYISLIEMIS